jgi:hypothetical protein
MSTFASDQNAFTRDTFARRCREVLGFEENRQRLAEIAYQHYLKSFGCSQSMLQAFQDVLELRDDFWFKAVGGLQGGGSCGLTCGALATGFLLIGGVAGRNSIDQGFEGIIQAFEPSQKLALWFKPMFKSTICSEITGLNWYDLNEVANHYFGPKGPETIENCARLTSTTSLKVAEILSEL